MGVPESTRPASPLAAALIVALVALAGCSTATEQPLDGSGALPPQAAVVPPIESSQVPPEREAPPTPPLPEPAAPQLTPEQRAEGTALDPARERAKTLIVIDTAEQVGTAEDQDLAAAARRERERRRSAEQPIAVIDQKNLATWAAGGVLTQTSETATPSAAESAATEMVEKAAIEEAYWRRRGREIRQRWHDAHEQIAVLEAKSNDLRNQFYATDDGYRRDSQIKPEWDKAIADLEEARYTAARGADEVLAFLEEGRRAGALPGWLREGVELEPEPVLETAAEPGGPLEAQEPVIYRDGESVQEPNDPPPGAPRQ